MNSESPCIDASFSLKSRKLSFSFITCCFHAAYFCTFPLYITENPACVMYKLCDFKDCAVSLHCSITEKQEHHCNIDMMNTIAISGDQKVLYTKERYSKIKKRDRNIQYHVP